MTTAPFHLVLSLHGAGWNGLAFWLEQGEMCSLQARSRRAGDRSGRRALQ